EKSSRGAFSGTLRTRAQSPESPCCRFVGDGEWGESPPVRLHGIRELRSTERATACSSNPTMKLTRSLAVFLFVALARADNVLVAEGEGDAGNVLVEAESEGDGGNVLVAGDPGAGNDLETDEPGSGNVRISQEPTIESPVPACALIKCSDKGDGVCGSDGATYVNECQLTAAQCAKPGLYQVSEGPCAPSATPAPAPRQCPSVCPRIYLPVCDARGSVYGNACAFMQAKCQDDSLELVACPKSKCSLPHCAPIEKPICASNGKTYMNRCLYSYFACKDPSLRVEHDGECGCGLPASDGDGAGEAATRCAAILCREFSECRVDERTGRGYCADVCDPKRCGAGEKCKLRTVQCFTTPCPPIAECVFLRLVLAALVVVTQQQFSVVADGSLDKINCESPSVCTDDDPQVCGSDGVTYANKCSFELAYCDDPKDAFVVASEGECPKAAPPTPAPTTMASPPTPVTQDSNQGKQTTAGDDTAESAAETPTSTVSTPPQSLEHQGKVGGADETRQVPTPTPAPTVTKSAAEVTETSELPTPTPTPAPTVTKSVAEVETPTTVEVTMSGTVATKCNPICAKVYEPVCGSNAVTYANQCLLDYAACRDPRVMKMNDGKCPKRSSTCVPEMCSAIDDPVCGSDGETYLNDCMFHNAKCRLNSLTVLHDGECNEDTPLKCATLTCPQFTECREDEDGEVAFCADVCAAERCGAAEECQLLDSECFTAPCSPVATCVPIQVEAES
ncbi:hypothetical protein PybrP1_011434, partial [[Pythium] brassicae (nom. inval.)]